MQPPSWTLNVPPLERWGQEELGVMWPDAATPRPACLATTLLWRAPGWAWTTTTLVLSIVSLVEWAFSWFLCARSTLRFSGLRLLMCFPYMCPKNDQLTKTYGIC